MDIKIPTPFHIEKTKAGCNANQAEGAEERLIDQLCGSVLKHRGTLLLWLSAIDDIFII
jgi:hypothetical protein